MVGLPSEVTWPELCGLERWSMNHELVRLDVERSCRLKTSNVRSMTKLRLSVAANHLPMVALRDKSTDLLLVTEL